jgi:hypothetical protein
VTLVPDQGAVEQLVAAGPHPSLHDRVHSRDPDTAADGLDAGVGEDLVDEGRELPVPVPDAMKERGLRSS